jgi:carbamoylphosphate synthase small subunit
MRYNSSHIKLENFVKSRLKDRRAMSRASNNIDEFRKTYGKAVKGFDSTAIIRKMRDTRQGRGSPIGAARR